MRRINIIFVFSALSCLILASCLSVGVDKIEVSDDNNSTEPDLGDVSILEMNDTITDNTTPQETEDEYEDLDPNDNVDTNVTYSISERIASSVVAAKGDYPFMAYLTITTGTGTRYCSGALLTTEYVLTAGSCVHDASKISVGLGGILATDATQTIVGTAITHPKYFSKSQNYDIALVKLSAPAVLDANVGVVSLALKEHSDDNKDIVSKTMFVLGYGLQTAAGVTIKLSYTSMKVMSSSKCYREMRRNVARPGSAQSCLDTYNSGIVGMCSPSDIGGPVLFKYDDDLTFSVVGVLNYYQSCLSSTPNVFTRVGEYWDLINKYIPNYG